MCHSLRASIQAARSNRTRGATAMAHSGPTTRAHDGMSTLRRESGFRIAVGASLASLTGSKQSLECTTLVSPSAAVKQLLADSCLHAQARLIRFHGEAGCNPLRRILPPLAHPAVLLAIIFNGRVFTPRKAHPGHAKSFSPPVCAPLLMRSSDTTGC